MIPSTLSAVPLPLERLGGVTRDAKAEAAELRKLRKGFALTQVQMAQLLDVSAPTYSRWERGAIACPLTALELMRAWARERAQEAQSSKKTKRKA
jgi:DNA-binding transcriptional regulator YiaG